MTLETIQFTNAHRTRSYVTNKVNKVGKRRRVHLPSDLHVSSLCCFYSGVDQTFSTSHSVKEELRGGQTRIKAVCHKALCSRELKHKRTNHRNMFLLFHAAFGLSLL